VQQAEGRVEIKQVQVTRLMSTMLESVTHEEKIMTKLRTILLSGISLALFSQACATDAVSFSHPSPASSTSIKYEATCGQFEWKVSFKNIGEEVSGDISVSFDGNTLNTINSNNDVLKLFSRLELPAVTCTARQDNDGLFATTNLLLLGVDKSGDNTDYLTQISVDESLQYEVIED